jgi:LETM1 and EF-hand domain-containing protein 1, mitochondrial
MIEPTAREAEELKTARKPDKKEQLYNISQALAVLASASV